MSILKKLIESVRYVFVTINNIEITLKLIEIFKALPESWSDWLILFLQI